MAHLVAARRLLFLGLFFSVLEAVPSRAQSSGADLQLERDTFVLVNQYRVAQDLPGLTWSPEAAMTARAHSKDMALGTVDFGHAGFGDRVKRLRSEMVGFVGCGENVLMTSDPRDAARAAVDLWLKSPPHLHNIRGKFGLSGIGVWESAEGMLYFTQIFIRISANPPPEGYEN